MKTAAEILDARHHCVIASPPYLTEKDPAKRLANAVRYTTAGHAGCSLSAPYTERLFQLVRPDGFVAAIVSNSFIKREFGKRLREEVLPRVDLTHLVNSSGAYIRGVGMPTLIFAGTGGAPRDTPALLASTLYGEPSTPPEGEAGVVWNDLLAQLGMPPASRRGPEDDLEVEPVRAEDDFSFEPPWYVRDLLCQLALAPALARHGTDTTVLDPACGTGRLLCAAFWRIFGTRTRAGQMREEAAADALDAVRGVEADPAKASAARRRLARVYREAAGPGRAPTLPRPHVAAGNALLAGRVRPSPPEADPVARPHLFAWAEPEAPGG